MANLTSRKGNNRGYMLSYPLIFHAEMRQRYNTGQIKITNPKGNHGLNSSTIPTIPPSCLRSTRW